MPIVPIPQVLTFVAVFAMEVLWSLRFARRAQSAKKAVARRTAAETGPAPSPTSGRKMAIATPSPTSQGACFQPRAPQTSSHESHHTRAKLAEGSVIGCATVAWRATDLVD